MNVELSRDELDALITSLQQWVNAIESGTPAMPAGSRNAYLARRERRRVPEALLEKLRAARNAS
jgi:hypothetical protein